MRLTWLCVCDPIVTSLFFERSKISFLFKTNEECVSYLQTYNTHVNKTLQDHLDMKGGDAVVLFIGCSEKSKFAL